MSAMTELEAKARRVRNYFRRRARDYSLTFGEENAPAQRVLADLHDKCFKQPLGVSNPFDMARYVGRREIWDHIQDVLGYDEKQVVRLVTAERDQKERDVAIT